MTRRRRREDHGEASFGSRVRRRSQRGAVALEFALIAPMLLVLVFGIIDFGMLIQSKTQIANAAYEGARNGSISHSEAAIDAAVTKALGNIPAKDVTITVSCKGPAPAYVACPAGGLDAN